MRKYKENINGITLVSLIVTIVVLLIIAGITINSTISREGAVDKALELKEDARALSVEQEKNLWLLEVKEGYTKKNLNDILQELKQDELLTEEEVTEIINSSKKEITIAGKTISFLSEIEKVEPANINDWEYTIDAITNTATITCYKGTDTVVIVPNYINGVPVKTINGSTSGNLNSSIWSSDICEEGIQKTITAVIISEGIENVGDNTFGYTQALESIRIPNTVVAMGKYAFRNCSSLTNIQIPSSLSIIEQFAFYYCGSLTNIDIPSSVTNIGNYAFSNCTGLASINIPKGVTRIGSNAFQKCSSLKNINIPGTVTVIGVSAFSVCMNLESVILEKGIQNIMNTAFADCRSLKTLDIPSTVTTIGTNAFQTTNALITINIDKAENSIEGSPWGAPIATVNWTGAE